jgi:hypothetical protein
MKQGTKKGKRKQRQKDKTAAKDIDPYFGDLTKAKPSCNSTKNNCNYQGMANSLSEMFPGIDKNIINDLLDAHKGNFDATLNSLIEMNVTKAEEAILNNKSLKLHTEPTVHNEKEDEKALELKVEYEQNENKPEETKNEINNNHSKNHIPMINNELKEISREDKLEEEEEYTEEYSENINELALNSVADELISKYPK